MKTTDLKNLIQQDQVGKPDSAIEDRLQGKFVARASSYRVHYNSFANFFTWLLGPKQLATKLAVTTLLFTFAFIRPVSKMNSESSVIVDSTYVNKSYVLDSAMLILPQDTTGKRLF